MRAALLVVLAACPSTETLPPVTEPTAPAPPVTEVAVVDVVDVSAIAVDDKQLFVAVATTVMRAEKRPKAKLAKVAAGTRPVGLALDAAYVWWGDVDGVYRAPRAGGKPERMNKRPVDVVAFAKRGVDMIAGGYNAAENATAVVRFTPDGAVLGEHAVAGRGPVFAIADDGFYIGTDRTIARITRDGKLEELAKAGDVSASAIAVDADHVFFAWRHELIALFPASGLRKTLDTTRGDVLALAIDATHVYWVGSEDGSGGTLQRIPIAGGKPEIIERLPVGTDAIALALDDEYVYWTNKFSKQILRKRKS